MSNSNTTMLSHDATLGYDIRTNENGLLFVVITLSALATCFTCILVSFLSRRVFGIQGCLPLQDDAAWEQIRQNRLMALRQQRYGISTAEEEGPEWERMMEKRKERREWYQEYLKPFTMVAKETDFVISSNQMHHGSDMDHETTGTTEEGGEEMPSSSPVSSLSQLGLHDSHHSHQCGLQLRKMVTLQPTAAATTTTTTSDAATGKPAVVVASSCAICLGEYEVGDRIIWASQPQCRHAFHDDCILTWLSKGKKRCPICRNWFVPKTLFDELKKQQPMLPSVQSEVDEDIEEVDEEEQRGAVNNNQCDEHVDDETHNNEGGDLEEADYLSERRTAQTADASRQSPTFL